MVQLVSPPLVGIAEFYLFPYAHLNQLDFLNKQFFIAGVNNPLFKHRPQWWDVFGDLDTGEVIAKCELSKHQPLLDNLLRLPATESEYQMRSMFLDYTQNLIDCAVLDDEIGSYSSLIGEAQQWRRSRSFELYTYHFKNKVFRDEGKNIHFIYRLLTRLKVKNLLEDCQDLEVTYEELERVLESEQDILDFLSMLPNQGDLHCLTWVFYTQNARAAKTAFNILKKVEKTPVTYT